MTVEQKARLKAELEKADNIYMPMYWHNKLFSIASMLVEDKSYTREDAARDIVKVMREMQEEIAGMSRGELNVVI